MKPKFTVKIGLPFTAAFATTVLTLPPVRAGILFTESFETPDITGYVQGTTPTGWVRAAQGFNSPFHGLIDQDVDGDGGLAFASPSTQGYSFRYTNSGFTTAVGVIGSLSLGVTYTVSADVVKDVLPATGATPYTMQLLAVAPGAARDDARSVPIGSVVLGSASGNAPADGSVQSISINFTPSPAAQLNFFGYDLAVRFLGATTSANIDNVQVSSVEPPTAYWDINGSTAGAGGPAATGIWDGSTTNWNSAADGSGAPTTWTGGQAVFAAGTDATDPYTITVNGSRDINLLNFQEGSIALVNGTAGALNLTGNTPVTIASGVSASIGTPVTEDVAGRQLLKLGLGSLTLAGNNTYTGLTTVLQGALIFSGTDNSAATGGTLITGGVAQFDSPGSISGAGLNVTINAGGTMAFGPTFGSGNIAAALQDRVVDASAGTIAVDNYASMNFDFQTSFKSAAFLGAVSNVNYTGTFTPNGTVYRLGGGSGTLTMANTNALTGAGKSVIIRGSVTLAAANNHDGGTTLNSGILTLGDSGSLGSGPLIVAGPGTIQASGALVLPNLIAANSNFTVGGTEALTLAGEVTLNATRIITNTNTTTTTTFGAISRDLTNNRNLTIAGVGNTTVNGIISLGTGTLTKSDAGWLTLQGANTYSGTTTVTGGRLILGGSNSTVGATTLTLGQLHLASASNGGLASGNLNFGNTTQFNAVIQAVDADRTISNNVTLNNTHGSIAGDFSLTINGIFTNSAGNRTLTSSIVEGKTLTLAGQVKLSEHATTGRTFTVAGTGSTVISGQIVNGSTGAGALAKTGTGILTLTNNTNSYGGGTTVNGGTLALGANDVLPNTTNISIGAGTLNGATFSDTVGTLDVTSTAAIVNLGAAATIAFADSSLVDWTGGTLNITGAFVSGSSLRFGTTDSGLRDDQLAQISSAGLINFDLNANGYLTASVDTGSPYTSWAGPGVAFNGDANGDGVQNGLAWLLGASGPNTNGTGVLPIVTQSGGNLVMTFKMLNAANRGTAVMSIQHSSDMGITDPWFSVVVPETSSTVDGVTFSITADGKFNNVIATIPASESASGRLFGRANATE